jgi:hypothetical protein
MLHINYFSNNMSRYKYLKFRLDREALSNDILSKAFLIKVYNKYQIRNELYNWNGDTNVRHTALGLFELSLQATMDSAEIQRTQGTVFGIDESPALCFIGNKHALIITQLFSLFPFRSLDLSDIEMPLSLSYIEENLNIEEWCVSAMYTGNTEDLVEVKNSEIYYSRTSKSTGSKSHLGWNLEQRNINCDKISQFLKELEIQIA